MAREGVNFEKVAGICDALQAEGRKISVRAIQAESGGSMSTVLEHYRCWQERQAVLQDKEEKLSDQFKSALLAEISLHIEATRAGMIARLKEAEARAREGEELLREAEGRAEELRAVIKEGEQARGVLEKQLAAAEEKAAAGEKRTAELERTIGELRQAHVGAEKRIAVAEARAEDRDRQITGLQDQLKEEKDEKVKTGKEKTESEKRAAVAEAKFADL